MFEYETRLVQKIPYPELPEAFNRDNAHSFAREVVREHFDCLPRWVNTALFYEDLASEIVELLEDPQEYTWSHKKNDYYVDTIYVLGSIVGSGSIDIGDGKCDEEDFYIYLKDLYLHGVFLL